MKLLNYPTLTTTEVFTASISKVKSAELKTRLENALPAILNAVTDYETKAPQQLLHTIAPVNTINANVSRAEMEAVYTSRLVGKTAPGRPYYDQILNSSYNNICPLCNQRIVDALDHHLPKADFPIFSVAPINLVPACIKCNKDKGKYVPTNVNNEPIHPYFDNFDDEAWLSANIVFNEKVTATFFVTKPVNWSTVKYNRMLNHFNSLELASLYASHGAAEIGSIKLQITELYNTGGEQAVREHLARTHISKENHDKNAWQSALYKALLHSNQYITGGFNI